MDARRWMSFGESVRGWSHIRDNKPNQDCLRCVPQGKGPSAIIAVADGHGSPLYFRSDKGSLAAVEASISSSVPLIKKNVTDQVAIEGYVLQTLIPSVVSDWQARCTGDIEDFPFTDTELSKLDEKKRSEVKADPLIPYGTTSLLVILQEQFHAYSHPQTPRT